MWLFSISTHILELNEFCVQSISQTRILGGSCSLSREARSGIPGLSLIILMDMTFRAACTPTFVRAARWMFTFVYPNLSEWSVYFKVEYAYQISALSSKTASSLTGALKTSPSIARPLPFYLVRLKSEHVQMMSDAN